MNKFTIFTIILAVSVVTVMADLGFRERYGYSGQTSVITSENPAADQKQTTPPAVTGTTTDPTQVPLQPNESDVSTGTNTPAASYIIPPPSSNVTQEKVTAAGFTGSFTEKHFDGKVFQLLDITKIPVEAIGLYEITQDGTPVVTVMEIALKDEIKALQTYVLLQNKTKPYIDLSLNETNAYGDRSFYINHAKKPGEAFLTVKIGKMIYSFAYVKFYHPEIKKLIQLLIP